MSNYRYKTREVRDLAWACFSPALFHGEKLSDDGQNIANCALNLTAARQTWLRELDERPAALLKHLTVLHNNRLGLYFESLWHFFLQEDAGVDLVAHNLPVREKGRTIGEFDCLYYCRQRKRHFHLELAVKYYLGHRQSTTNQRASHWREWLGPNNTDHLDRKINHLTQHQIQLSDHPAAKESLEQLGISSVLKEIEIKGYLFNAVSDPLPAPYAHNHANMLCHWVTIDKLENYIDTGTCSHFLTLAKPRWLALARADSSLMDQKETVRLMSEYFQKQEKPLLLAAFNDSEYESQRIFVTGTSWPKLTS